MDFTLCASVLRINRAGARKSGYRLSKIGWGCSCASKFRYQSSILGYTSSISGYRSSKILGDAYTQVNFGISQVFWAIRQVFRGISQVSGAIRQVFRGISQVSGAIRQVFRAIGQVKSWGMLMCK